MKILKFGSVSCNACMVMAPRFEKIENDWQKKHGVKLDTQFFEVYDNENKAVVEKYKIGEGIPVFIFLNKNGQELERMSGEIAEDVILEKIKKYLDK